MNKYIQDCVRNNSRSIIRELTVPQQKAVSEIIRGLFTAGTPILRALGQNKEVSKKKQADKYSWHLGNIQLKEKVEAMALNKVKQSIRQNTIIAYDLTDINKDAAKKMAKLKIVFDGSKRSKANGYTLHGLGLNGILLKLEVHDGDAFTQNQVRRQIVEAYATHFGGKGIWVFDRGNDHKHFFKFLRQEVKVQFISRLKANRGVVMKETGAIITVDKLPHGQYQVYLMNENNNKVDLSAQYTLVVFNHLGNSKQPLRLLASLKNQYSSLEIVTMYLQRWGIENIFKRAKQKFNLEKIRVLSYKKFVNLICLIQFALNVSTVTFIKIQNSTYSLISGVLMSYKNFLRLKSLTFNLDSFISFMQQVLKPLTPKPKPPPLQLSLFSSYLLKKLGPF